MEGPKLDTVLSICLNRNPGHVTLSEPLYNVDFIRLDYFRLANMSALWWPAPQLYLELDNLKARPRLTSNVIRSGDWSSTISAPPTAAHYPLYFKTDPIDTGARIIYGRQHLHIEDIGRLSDFEVKLCGPQQTPIEFDVNTVLQLVFTVHYQGKRNLDPNEHVRLYSKYQN